MLEESGDEEETNGIVNKVLDEIGIEISGKVISLAIISIHSIHSIYFPLCRCQMRHRQSGTLLDIPQSNPAKISILKHNWQSLDRRDVKLSLKPDHCEHVLEQFQSIYKGKFYANSKEKKKSFGLLISFYHIRKVKSLKVCSRSYDGNDLNKPTTLDKQTSIIIIRHSLER